jgi:hypothetical protein
MAVSDWPRIDDTEVDGFVLDARRLLAEWQEETRPLDGRTSWAKNARRRQYTLLKALAIIERVRAEAGRATVPLEP